MGKYPIKPAARMITTIGRDLIKDIPASIVELVKNSYDADAENVEIIFSKYLEGKDYRISIEISDDGHGMDFSTITNTWLVPATANKLHLKESRYKKRKLQGRKGIGRYAVAILGNYLQLETVHNNEKTIVYIDWNEFESKEYLEEVSVEVETEKVNQPNGTILRIIGEQNYFEVWSEKELNKLIKELRKLLSPFQGDATNDKFEINLITKDFIEDSSKFNNYSTIIEPLPIVGMFNYRLFGNISEEGIAKLFYENNSLKVSQIEEIEPFKIELKFEDEKYCGPIELDLRVFDLDIPSVDSLRQKLSHTSDITFTRREITNELKEIVGVGIYRGGFRIRPHGDKGFDWLGLDGRRVQNPSMRIGFNQMIGYISIQSEEVSNLEEKSARDGLKENPYYEGLIQQVIHSLMKLEERRFDFRRRLDQSKEKNIYQKMESLFDFSDFQNSINKSIDIKFDEVSKGKNQNEVKQEFIEEINKKIIDIQKEKEKEYEEIKQIIALYQGQATLGSITTTVLHEGRKHTSWFSNTLPRVVEWLNEYKEESSNELLIKSIDRLKKANDETNSLLELFDKLDPLTITKKGKVKKINIAQIIDHVENVFRNELISNSIRIIKEFEVDNIIWKGYENDIRIVFTNLVENSIYWLKRDIENKDRYIKFSVEYTGSSIEIDIIDNGPGIEKSFIENNTIFTPGFSAKESGTGLGLAISGEAIRRNNGSLIALYSDEGAHFRIELGGKEVEY